MAENVDVVVIGAGSGGENLAMDLAERGLTVVVVEEDLVGGECPFVACVPSKAMIHGASSGLTWDAAVAHRDDVTSHRDDGEHAGGLRASGATLLRGRGRITGRGEVTVGDRVFEADHVVIATGAANIVPPVDIDDGVEHWTSVEAWTTTTRPESMAVVGGGPVGIEIATVYARYGTRVVVVEREEQLLSGEDPEVVDELVDHLRDLGIDVRTDTELTSVGLDGDHHVLHVDDDETIVVEQVVFASGKRPRLRDIGLEEVGLDPDEPLDVGRDGRVAGVDDLWAVGDVSGLPAFTHVANALAEVVAGNIADGGSDQLDVAQAPRCVFSDPPFAAVGSTSEDDADDRGVRVRATHEDLARPATDRSDPLLAVLAVRADRTIRGFTACGPNADELVGILALAIHTDVTVDQLATTIFPFPTFSEVVRLLAQRARGELDG